jgi:cytochrome c-type biogenesis protein CcmH
LRDRGVRAALVLVLALAAPAAAVAADPEAEYDKAARTILCDCGCHPQSVHDCACGRAAQMRDEIRAEVRAGKTGDQIVADRVARSGEKVRVVPKASGFNLLAWLGPGVALVGAAGFVVLVLKRWRRSPPDESAGSPAAAAPLDAAAQARLERELRELR